MTGLLKMILRPNDGRRRTITEEVQESIQQRKTASSRFEETVRELLEVNDRITGRNEDARANFN